MGIAEDQRQMFGVLELGAVGERLRPADGGVDLELPRADDELLPALAVGDEVGDGDDLEVVLGGEAHEFRQALHGAVVVDDLGEQADGRAQRRFGQIEGRFGVPGAHQHAALAGDQREDVARPHEVLGGGVVARERQRRAGPLLGGDAGGEPHLVVDADRERGRHRRVVARHHRFEVQALRLLLVDRRTQDAAGVADHEGDLLGRRLRRGHDEVALVLAVVVVHHDHEVAGGDGADGVFDGIEICGHAYALQLPATFAGQISTCGEWSEWLTRG